MESLPKICVNSPRPSSGGGAAGGISGALGPGGLDDLNASLQDPPPGAADGRWASDPPSDPGNKGGLTGWVGIGGSDG